MTHGEQMAERLRRFNESSASGCKLVVKTIHLTNDDCPEYLENLRRFDEESRKVRVIVN
jgi:hypothetical protein